MLRQPAAPSIEETLKPYSSISSPSISIAWRAVLPRANIKMVNRLRLGTASEKGINALHAEQQYSFHHPKDSLLCRLVSCRSMQISVCRFHFGNLYTVDEREDCILGMFFSGYIVNVTRIARPVIIDANENISI